MLSVIKQAAFLLFNYFVPNPLNRPQPQHIHAQPTLTAHNNARHPHNQTQLSHHQTPNSRQGRPSNPLNHHNHIHTPRLNHHKTINSYTLNPTHLHPHSADATRHQLRHATPLTTVISTQPRLIWQLQPRPAPLI